MAKEKNFLAKAKAWAKSQGLHGQNAFLRYVMFVFTENINRTTDDFVFKGGNLLWLYIHTPRATVDLDFATISLSAHQSVRAILEDACKGRLPEIEYRIIEFKEIEQLGESGAAVRIGYATHDGAANSFDIDIVYTIGKGDVSLPSPIENSQTIRASALEKIVADKITTCHRFKSGNTRMKDFDDLWRISKANKRLDAKLLGTFLSNLPVCRLNPEWAEAQMELAWENHRKRYPDLPKTLKETIDGINRWLAKVTGSA